MAIGEGRMLRVLGRLGIDAAGPGGTAAAGAGGDRPSTRGTVLPGRRAELVFAYLAAEHHRSVSQDELANALWPDELPGAWAPGLRGVVTEVRRFLEASDIDPEALVTIPGGYRLDLPPGTTTDLDQARALAARALAVLAGDPPAADAAEAAEAAATTASLAGLPFLPGHDGEWADGVRRELEELRVRALDLEARARAASGDPAGAATAARRLVDADPLNEQAHQLRIRLLAEAGDHAGARVAYERCRSVLAAELGTTPSPETDAVLARALARGAPAVVATRPPTPRMRPAGDAAAPRTAVEHRSAPAGARRVDPAAAGAGPPAPVPELGAISVLVVEDHAFQRRVALQLLRGLGITSTAEAGNGLEALDLLAASTPPDLIVCDIDMPGMDGVEFVRHVAERGLASAVVITSALEPRVLAAVEAVTAGYGLTVLGALEKPLNARRLGELLAQYLRPDATPAAAGPAPSGADIRRALADDQLAVEYRPTLDLATARIGGAAARLVLPGPGGTPVASAPLERAVTAEGLATAFGEQLLERSLGEMAPWRAAGLDATAELEGNPAILLDVDLADRLADVVDRLAADAHAVTWELPEIAIGRDTTRTLGTLTRLRLKGFGVAVVHAGTSSSPPGIIARVPLTGLRLDRRLVHGAAGNPRRIASLEAALELGADLRVPVVVDGCDTQAEFDLLVALGCRHVRGRYVGEPSDAAGFVRWAAGWEPPRGTGLAAPAGGTGTRPPGAGAG